MKRSEGDGPPADAADIENVMQEVRRQILERQLPGQLQLPETADALPPEYYEHLFRAGLAQSRVEVEMLVTKSPVPLIGPLIDRLRVKVHELVVFYINRFADNQAAVNNHMLQALALLGRRESEPGAFRQSSTGRSGTLSTRSEEWATPDDVYACYRLLLGRRPDESGWEYWSNMVESQPVSRAFLVDSFLGTEEFRNLQAERFRPVLIDLPDFRINVRLNDAFIGMRIAHDKSYEPHVSRIVGDVLGPGMTFVDVGANIGYFSLLAAVRVGPGGRVIAFEPNEANCELLRQSIAANGFGPIIDLQPVAVAEARLSLPFTTSGIDSNGRVLGRAESSASNSAPLSVEAVALDEALADCDRVDVIKIDVEGAEQRVWRGMQAIVRRHHPVLVFEFSPTLLRRTSEVEPEAFLEDVRTAYDLYIISPEGTTAAAPDSVATIMERHAASGQAHLDILARPRR